MKIIDRQRIGPALGRLTAVITTAAAVLGFAPPGQAQTDSGSPASGSASAASAPSPVAVPGFRQANNVAVLTVHGEIDQITLKSLERRVEQAKRDGADAIVLDIDTPGGDVLATLDILHLINTAMPANTVAWINPRAYSAGTIIALAAREIVVAPDASLGDAAPIQGAPGFGIIPMPAAERAKQESPILIEVIDSARRNHYDENLVQAFVSVGVELWLIENKTTGQRVFVGRDEYQAVFGAEPPQQMVPVAPPAPAPGPRPAAPPRITPWLAPEVDPAAEETPPLDPEQARKEIEREQMRPPLRQSLGPADRDQWQLLRQVDTADRLLTLKGTDALAYGLAVQAIRNDEELKSFFGAQSLKRYDQNWSESLVRFLTSWPVMGVLLVIFLVCLFIELSAPGIGVFGAAAVVALAILVGAPALAGMAQWWEIALILAGLALVALELFILPGFGISGVLGVAALLIGLVGLFVSDDLTTAQGRDELYTGLATTIASLFAAGFAIWLASRYFKLTSLFDRFALTAELTSPGHDEMAGGLVAAMGRVQQAMQTGDQGLAETDLRPSGRASFDGRMVDVVSVSGYIPSGRPVRVVSVGRFAIEVEDASA